MSEGSAEHVFLLRRGQIVSPPSTADNLEGITRRTIVEIARTAPLSIEFVERSISRTELYVAAELFLCGTGAEVTPVGAVDHRRIGTGGVGAVTRAIQQRLENPLSKLLLEGRFVPKDTIHVGVDPIRNPGQFSFSAN